MKNQTGLDVENPVFSRAGLDRTITALNKESPSARQPYKTLTFRQNWPILLAILQGQLAVLETEISVLAS